MSRSLDTSGTKIKAISKNADNFGNIVAGSLAEDYDGVGRVVQVRLGRTSSSGIARAIISPNTLIKSSYPEGTPVSLKIHRGRLEVISFGAAALPTIITALEKRGASQSIADGLGSAAKVTFSTSQVLLDPYSTFDDSADSITVPFDGYYRLGAYIRFDSDKGARRLWIYLDGTETWLATCGSPATSAGTDVSASQGPAFYSVVSLSEGQTVQLYASQNSGASLVLNAAALSIEMVK